MIGSDTASKMGIRFLEEEKCFRLAGGLEQGDCVDETFEEAIRTLGKKRVAQLYKKLPKQLKIYVLRMPFPSNDKRFEEKFMKIWMDHPNLHHRDHPDRCKGFKDYYRESEEALLKYLGVK